MTKFAYRPCIVEAFQYQGEHVSNLPDWVQSYRLKAPSPYGNSAVGTSITHDLLIPTLTGVITVRKTDWVVLEDEQLYAVNNSKFVKLFEPSPALETTETSVE